MRELTEKDLEHTAISLKFREMNFDKLLPDLIAEKEKGLTAEEIIDKYLHTADFDKKKYGRAFAEVDIYDLFKEPEINQTQVESVKETEEENKEEQSFEIFPDEITEVPEDEVVEETKPLEEQDKKETTSKMSEAEKIIEEENKSLGIEMEIKDENLLDFPNQPFSEYDEEEKEAMKESIALHGIINRLIVRPLKGEEGKYQILAGHNRRKCARELGYETFPCVVRNDLKDKDAEAMQILIDTNLATRKKIKPMDRAKAIAEKKKFLDDKQTIIKFDAARQHQTPKLINIYKELTESMNTSKPMVIRLLKLNKLNKNLHPFINSGAIPMKAGELLDCLSSHEQGVIANLLRKNANQNGKFILSESMANKLKKSKEKGEISDSVIKDILFPSLKSKEKFGKDGKQYKIIFTNEELASILQKLEQKGQEINEINIKSEILRQILM